MLLDIDTPTTQEITITITTITTIVTTVFDFKDCNLFAICLFVTGYYIGLWIAYPTLLYQIFIRLDDRRDTLPEKSQAMSEL